MRRRCPCTFSGARMNPRKFPDREPATRWNNPDINVTVTMEVAGQAALQEFLTQSDAREDAAALVRFVFQRMVTVPGSVWVPTERHEKMRRRAQEAERQVQILVEARSLPLPRDDVAA